MEVRKDFGKRVAELSSSTPREAIANLLSALLPLVEAKTRPAGQPPVKLMGFDPGTETLKEKRARLAQEFMREMNDIDGPDPMRKLTKKGRAPRVRKALPLGRLSYVVPKNPKKAGSASAKRFDNYYALTGYSASEIVRVSSITATDIAWDVDHGYIKFQ